MTTSRAIWPTRSFWIDPLLSNGPNISGQRRGRDMIIPVAVSRAVGSTARSWRASFDPHHGVMLNDRLGPAGHGLLQHRSRQHGLAGRERLGWTGPGHSVSGPAGCDQRGVLRRGRIHSQCSRAGWAIADVSHVTIDSHTAACATMHLTDLRVHMPRDPSLPRLAGPSPPRIPILSLANLRPV